MHATLHALLCSLELKSQNHQAMKNFIILVKCMYTENDIACSCCIGEIKTNFEEQKYFSLITTVFEDMPKKHEWRLELYERKETYIIEW